MGPRRGSLEGLVTSVTNGSLFGGVYEGRRVFVTGHTGFKGSWLTFWLLSMGAKVTGYSLEPPTEPSLFDKLGLADKIDHHIGDVRDLAHLQKVMAAAQPEIVLHLAAQPLVRLSYDEPVETFETNVMGSVNVLEAARHVSSVRAIVNVTSDKCYENREWLHAYREEDVMGGHDPYSASKGAAEIVISSFRRSYFSSNRSIVLASARAGNVIGGGDWAKDRIIPDCFLALSRGESISVRNKIATRPWQHVLEPLSGYLWLAASLSNKFPERSSAFNFGPSLSSNRTVAELVIELLKHTGGEWIDATDPNALHEASMLNLSIDKAFHLLSWKPVWSFEETISKTAKWYLAPQDAVSIGNFTRYQIAEYSTAASIQGIEWADQMN